MQNSSTWCLSLFCKVCLWQYVIMSVQRRLMSFTVSRGRPHPQTCSDTVWPSAPYGVWKGAAGLGSPAALWAAWCGGACRRSRTGTAPGPCCGFSFQSLRLGLDFGSDPSWDPYGEGCRRSYTGRSKSGWPQYGCGSPPRWLSDGVVGSCTSLCGGSGALSPPRPPGWRKAPLVSAAIADGDVLRTGSLWSCVGMGWLLVDGAFWSLRWCRAPQPVWPG